MKRLMMLLALVMGAVVMKAQVVPAESDPIGTTYTYKTAVSGVEMTLDFTYIAKEGDSYKFKSKTSSTALPQPYITETSFTVKDGMIVQSVEDTKKMIDDSMKQMGVKDVKVDVEGSAYNIPLTGKVGDTFPGATYTATVQLMGMSQKIESVTPDFKIVGEESITTPAGTFDCIIVEMKADVHVSVMGQQQTETTTQKMWMNKDRGMIKTETLDANNVKVVTELVSITKP